MQAAHPQRHIGSTYRFSSSIKYSSNKFHAFVLCAIHLANSEVNFYLRIVTITVQGRRVCHPKRRSTVHYSPKGKMTDRFYSDTKCHTIAREKLYLFSITSVTESSPFRSYTLASKDNTGCRSTDRQYKRRAQSWDNLQRQVVAGDQP